jgi:hypothetical protein
VCEDIYGVTPKAIVDGHVDIKFPYIAQPLENIMEELLRNSFRATAEFYRKRLQLL